MDKKCGQCDGAGIAGIGIDGKPATCLICGGAGKEEVAAERIYPKRSTETVQCEDQDCPDEKVYA